MNLFIFLKIMYKLVFYKKFIILIYIYNLLFSKTKIKLFYQKFKSI